MSLATNIKEFADILHNITAQQLSSITSTDIPSDAELSLAIPRIVVIGEVCTYLVKTLCSEIVSFLSFQWLRDVSYFPLLTPESQDRSSIVTDTFLSEPGSYLFSFSRNGVSLFSSTLQGDKNLAIKDSLLFNSFLKGDSLLAGFVNSFFFSLPFSLPHLVTLRRMFSQGASAAAASIFGTVAAHSFVLIGVIYGIRFLIIPFYSLEPLTFLIGTTTIAIVITEFIKEKRVYLVPLTHYPSLLRIAVLNFVLALCESATVFHDLHHLTLNRQISYLQLYESHSLYLPLFSPLGQGTARALDLFLSGTTYLLAFVFGQILFSSLFCYLILKANQKLCSFTGAPLFKTARQINKALLVVIITLTFSCFPYYGLDYLFTKSAGFLPEDPAYTNTIFSPTQVKSRNAHFKSGASATKNSKTPLELDLNYFDRGMYLNPPKQEKMARDPSFDPLRGKTQKFEKDEIDKIDKIDEIGEIGETYDPALTFEELNYQGESAWFMRHARARNIPEEEDLKKDSVFQKPKTHFKELRLKQDTKQASAALKETSQIGSIPEWKEGSRFGEMLPFYSEDLRNKGSHPVLQGAGKVSTAPLQGGLKERERVETGDGQNLRSLERRDSTPQQDFDKKVLLKELDFEKEVAAHYEKSFAAPFKEESDETPPDLLAIENIIKKRYRLNPVYRALLRTDIDSFIARQPADYKITQNQEANLFKKRQLLERYYNSIRYYAPIESISFANLSVDPNLARSTPSLPKVSQGVLTGAEDRTQPTSLDDPSARSRTNEVSTPYTSKMTAPFTKSFLETTYHQQFKGTLNTVKRFFRLTLDREQNLDRARILSYDQLLYRGNSRSPKEKGDRHPSLHEELELGALKGAPFVEESNSAPIYAGWDDKARRFVITNRFDFIE